jgi:sec-independent protein translocase protein TatB
MNLTPQVGFFEIVVIAVIALVVVGPKELPRLMRMAGKFAAQARRMAGEFQSAFNQMARESELDEMRREIEALKRNNPVAETKREVEAALRPVETSIREAAADAKKSAP